jgi:hypothetical protein
VEHVDGSSLQSTATPCAMRSRIAHRSRGVHWQSCSKRIHTVPQHAGRSRTKGPLTRRRRADAHCVWLGTSNEDRALYLSRLAELRSMSATPQAVVRNAVTVVRAQSPWRKLPPLAGRVGLNGGSAEIV